MRVVSTTIPEKRRDKRMTGRPLSIEIDAQRYEVEGWSMGGFLIGAYRGGRGAGERLEVRIIIVSGQQTIGRVVTAEIVRIDRNARSLAARFVDLDDAAYTMLEGWIAGAVRPTPQR
jgi:hypothetical protein